MEDLYFEIKGNGGFVKFRIISPSQYHTPEDWAVVDIALQCGSFSGAYTENIKVSHFFSFNDDFSKLYEKFKWQGPF